jgi:hypothetical protein
MPESRHGRLASYMLPTAGVAKDHILGQVEFPALARKLQRHHLRAAD